MRIPLIGGRSEPELDVERFGKLSGSLALCAEPEIRFGQTVVSPDESTAYAVVRLSHTWPVTTLYGECLSPATVRRSHGSMRNKPVSREHKIKSYNPQEISRDYILGSVVDVRFDWPGVALPRTEAEAPGVEVLVALFKASEGMAQMLGAHQSGRHEYTVSMEVRYRGSESGFLVGDGGGRETTPAAWRQAGWSYVSALEADEALLATRDWRRDRMADMRPDGRRCGHWNGAETYWLMGGLDGAVHYTGVGWVRYGAEPTARVDRLMASAGRGGGLPGASLWRAEEEA